jgi:hypothetical protein
MPTPPPAGEPDNPAKTESKWGKLLVPPLVVAVVLLVAFHFFDSSSDGGGLEPDFAAENPAEFLYLDTGRVASYVAQVNGGSFDEQKLSRKLTDTLSAKAVLTGLGEAGGSRAREVFLERVLKPTDASSFFALQTSLDDGSEDQLTEIRLRRFEEDIESLDEGQMVSFETSALLSPLYLNSYVAVKQPHTLEAMFPNSGAHRKEARRFHDDVGENPRVVFALQPTYRNKPAAERKPFKYLLPMSANGLTKERSLVKYGGGQFTVVGKLVRRFPQRGHKNNPAYIDSPTLETWEQPLRNEPGELLCRTERRCIGQVRTEERDGKLTGRERRQAIHAARKRVRKALKRQTTIDRRGAVILPVAIYK